MTEAPTDAGNRSKGHSSKRPGRLTRGLIWAVSILLGFFLLVTAVQVYSLQRRIGDAPRIQLAERENDVSRALIALEVHSVERRFHLAQVSLMSRLWVIYLGFVTGMILALVGAAFIVAKINEAQPSELSGKTTVGELNLKSTSPGLIMTVLGTALMMTTILTPQSGAVSEGALYLTAPAGGLSVSNGPPDDVTLKLWQSLSGGHSTGSPKPTNPQPHE